MRAPSKAERPPGTKRVTAQFLDANRGRDGSQLCRNSMALAASQLGAVPCPFRTEPSS